MTPAVPRKWRALLALLPPTLLVPLRATAQTAADSAGAAVSAFHAALHQGDSSAALALFTPDAVILESGELETLEEYRTHHLPADIVFARAVASSNADSRVTIAGSVAWVTTTGNTRGTFGGRAIDSQNAELVVLSREATGWRIRAVHWSSHSRRRSD